MAKTRGTDYTSYNVIYAIRSLYTVTLKSLRPRGKIEKMYGKRLTRYDTVCYCSASFPDGNHIVNGRPPPTRVLVITKGFYFLKRTMLILVAFNFSDRFVRTVERFSELFGETLIRTLSKRCELRSGSDVSSSVPFNVSPAADALVRNMQL